MKQEEIDLDAIEQEHAATSPGEWTLVPSESCCQLWWSKESDDCPCHYKTAGEGHQSECKSCEHWGYDTGAWFKGLKTVDCGEYVGLSDADAQFCAHAHQYVPALVAEVRGLRAENAELCELVRNSKVHMRHLGNCDATLSAYALGESGSGGWCTCGLDELFARADKALEGSK